MNARTMICAGALALGLALPSLPASAAYVVTLTQHGSDVIANGSGTVDTADLTFDRTSGALANVTPFEGAISTGPVPGSTADLYLAALARPSGFGPADERTDATSGSGDLVGIWVVLGLVILPDGHASGSSLTDSSTYAAQTLSSLHVTAGKYVWTWGRARTRTVSR